jgi:hypothetical protein
MKNFLVNVTTHGMIKLPNGRSVRTPVIMKLNESELQSLKVQLKAKGLEYHVENVSEDLEEKEIVNISKRVIIEELTTIKKNDAEPKTFLDKLILDEEK